MRERGSLVKGSNNEICSGAYKESRKGGGGDTQKGVGRTNMERQKLLTNVEIIPYFVIVRSAI